MLLPTNGDEGGLLSPPRVGASEGMHEVSLQSYAETRQLWWRVLVVLTAETNSFTFAELIPCVTLGALAATYCELPAVTKEPESASGSVVVST